jgi:AraC-like DNA-binding protein
MREHRPFPFVDRLYAPDAAASRWAYWRPSGRDVIEVGAALTHNCAPLATHFHDEAQITCLVSGRRTFLIGDQVIRLTVGHCAFIPARMPHRAVADDGLNAVCVNLYVPAADYVVPALLDDLQNMMNGGGAIAPEDLTIVLQRHRLRLSPPAPDCLPSELPVSVQAARAGLSREWFSRRFHRAERMPPHAFRLASRLNLARRMLRANSALADVAAIAGFADQSHLGRCFRRFFGTTPGSYRGG